MTWLETFELIRNGTPPVTVSPRPLAPDGDRQQQRPDEHEAGHAGGEQRRDDRAGNALRCVHDLLGDIAGRFEPVEDVDVRQDGDKGCTEPPVASRSRRRADWSPRLGALAREEVVEPVVEPGDRQHDGDPEGADDLEVDADL